MNVVLISTLGLYPYRTVEQVEKNLDISVFQACTELKEGLHSVRFSIRADGKALLLKGADCFSSVENIGFPKSPTVQDIFTWDVIYQEGVLFPQLLRKESEMIVFPGIFAQEKEKMLNMDEQND